MPAGSLSLTRAENALPMDLICKVRCGHGRTRRRHRGGWWCGCKARHPTCGGYGGPKGEPSTDAKEPAVSVAGSGTMEVSAGSALELQMNSCVAGANPSATATLATGFGEVMMVTAPAAHGAGGGWPAQQVLV